MGLSQVPSPVYKYLVGGDADMHAQRKEPFFPKPQLPMGSDTDLKSHTQQQEHLKATRSHLLTQIPEPSLHF